VKPASRPVYLDLRRIHLPITGWVSILHRVSGVLLFLALPLGTWALSVSLIHWRSCCCWPGSGRSPIISSPGCAIWRSTRIGASRSCRRDAAASWSWYPQAW
jgi:Succinate dehydrogenase/Fumarate reductase transmembrane subunit